MLRLPFRDPDTTGGSGSGGEDPTKGADADKADPKALVAALAKQVTDLEAQIAARTKADQEAAAQAAADKAEAERAEALKRGEHEKLLTEREAALKATTERLTALEAKEAARIAAAAKAADVAVAALPEALRPVAMAIPDPDARLAAVRVLAEQKPLPAGAPPRSTKAPVVVIPPEVAEQAAALGATPEAFYALQVKRGKIKPVQPVGES